MESYSENKWKITNDSGMNDYHYCGKKTRRLGILFFLNIMLNLEWDRKTTYCIN